MSCLTVAEATARLVSLFPAEAEPYRIPTPQREDAPCGDILCEVAPPAGIRVDPVTVRVTVSPADVTPERGDVYNALLDNGFHLVQEIRREPGLPLFLRIVGPSGSTCAPADQLPVMDGRARGGAVVDAPRALVIGGMRTAVLAPEGCDPAWAVAVLAGTLRPYVVAARAGGRLLAPPDVRWFHSAHPIGVADVAAEARAGAREVYRADLADLNERITLIRALAGTAPLTVSPA